MNYNPSQKTSGILKEATGLLILALILMSWLWSQVRAEDKSLLLPLGPKEHRGRFINVESGQLYSARKGKPVTFESMVREMKKARLIHVGETHDDLEMHEMQFRIIEALYLQDSNLAIGLEQVTVDLQPVLDRWVAGELDESSFLREIRWYVTWNFNYNYYKKIFDFAREHKLPIFALNAPRNLISKVRMQGYEALNEGEKKVIPSLDLNQVEHRLLVRTIFESEEIPPQMKGAGLDSMFEALYRAQVAWDETMGRNAVRTAEASGRRVVVLAGSGHLLYGLGLNLRTRLLSRWPQVTVIGIQVAEGSRQKVSRGLADFIYGVKAREYPAYPAVSINLKKVEGLKNLIVASRPSEALARMSGLDKGDVILSVDGQEVFEVNDFRMILAGFNWGEEIKFKVLRNGEVLDLSLKLDPAALGNRQN